jgi:hypothetical protein
MVGHEAEGIEGDLRLLNPVFQPPEQEQVILILDKQRFPTGSPLGNMGDQLGLVELPGGPKEATLSTAFNNILYVHAGNQFP